MAAMRPALARLFISRSSSRASAAATSLASPSTLPSFRPSARNLEGWRCFSTEGGESQNARSVLRMWWQRSRDRIRNANHADGVRFHLGCSSFLLLSAMLYLVKSLYFPGRKRTASLRQA